MTTSFARLGLPEPLAQTLARRGFDEPFPIQASTIPDALAGRDVAGKAPTGSGKTLAFGLPLLARVDEGRRRRPRALVLAPTRELAEQITQELDPLARAVHRQVFAIYGGVSYGPQRHALDRGVDVLVATPGRLEDLIDQGVVDLSDVAIAVVDEADRMADMGFLPAVRRILDQTNDDRQTLLFSATLDGDVAVLARRYQRDPVRHDADPLDSEADDAIHHFWLVEHSDRVDHTAAVVNRAGRSIVFTRTRRRADRLAKQMTSRGVEAVALHGGRSQNQRTRAIQQFASGRVKALVATDVAARGIHVDGVASVVHFDPPGDAKDYVHRSGRTARAGATGTVVTLVTGDQRRDVRRMQQELDLVDALTDPRLHEITEGRHVEPRRPARTSKDQSGRPDRPSRRDGATERLYVGNIPWSTTDHEIETLFADHGRVRNASVITDRKTGRSRGFAFVEMAPADARSAIASLDGSSLGGRSLQVRGARPRRRR